MIALALSTPQAIPRLLTYLDAFHTDPQAWSLLADLYADEGLYAQSLTALGQAMVIQPWDGAIPCRAGEVAWTMGYVAVILNESAAVPLGPGLCEQSDA